MTRKDKQLRLARWLLVLNLAVIWGNSLLPGEVSGAVSGFVRDMLSWLFPAGGDPATGHGLLRKLAHFTEFACLGGLLTWILSLLHKPVPMALGIGFLAACIDETIQLFAPDRGPAFTDVLLDTAGVFAGLCVFLLLRPLLRSN